MDNDASVRDRGQLVNMAHPRVRDARLAFIRWIRGTRRRLLSVAGFLTILVLFYTGFFALVTVKDTCSAGQEPTDWTIWSLACGLLGRG